MTGKILLNTFGLRLVNADTHNDVLPEPGLPQMSMAKEQLGNGSICRCTSGTSHLNRGGRSDVIVGF